MDEHNEQTSWLLNVKKIQISIHQSCFKELEPKNIFEISYRNKTNLNRQKTDFPTNSVSLSKKKKKNQFQTHKIGTQEIDPSKQPSFSKNKQPRRNHETRKPIKAKSLNQTHQIQ